MIIKDIPTPIQMVKCLAGNFFHPRTRNGRLADASRAVFKNLRISICVLLCLMPSGGLAGSFDGSQTLVCSVDNGRQFHSGGQTRPFDPQSVGLPRVFMLDFDRNRILPTKDSVVRRQTKIKRSESIENLMILQGVDDGLAGVDDGIGWNMAVDKTSGMFVISAAGAKVGYIVFGSCKPKP